MNNECVTLDIGGVQVQGIMTSCSFSGMTRETIETTDSFGGGAARTFMPGMCDPGELTVTYKLTGQPILADEPKEMVRGARIMPTKENWTGEPQYQWHPAKSKRSWLTRPITDWGRDWRVLAAACLIAWAMCGGCIRPVYNFYLGGDHVHKENGNAAKLAEETNGTDPAGLDDGLGTTGLFGPAGRGDGGMDGR